MFFSEELSNTDSVCRLYTLDEPCFCSFFFSLPVYNLVAQFWHKQTFSDARPSRGQQRYELFFKLPHKLAPCQRTEPSPQSMFLLCSIKCSPGSSLHKKMNFLRLSSSFFVSLSPLINFSAHSFHIPAGRLKQKGSCHLLLPITLFYDFSYLTSLSLCPLYGCVVLLGRWRCLFSCFPPGWFPRERTLPLSSCLCSHFFEFLLDYFLRKVVTHLDTPL